MTATPARTTGPVPPADGFERHRRELTAYCYRMLGSGHDAQDAVQETLLRAWRGAGRFEGRSAVRTWLYRIATNVCLDMLRGGSRRAVPMELGAARPPEESSLADVLPDGAWVSPIADDRVLPAEVDPAELAEQRESVRLAFVAALQHLPPRQRAVLILCEVLRWRAAEAAELLDSSVASVNSALQRARARLAEVPRSSPGRPLSDDDHRLLERYVDAFERYDMTALVGLLHADAIQSMPPFAMWLRGPSDIVAWMCGPGKECRGSRILRTRVNGGPALAQYRVDPGGGWAPWALQVLEVADGRVAGIHSFLDQASRFADFGLPEHLD